MRTLCHLLIALTLLAAVPLARAQLYVCTDARGRTITGDRPPPECADRSVRELRSDGSVRRVIEPPLTPEQKAAREAEAKRQREEAEKQRAQMRRDLALLETYASESEIEESRNRALGSRQQLIDRAVQRLAEHQRERKKLEDEAEFYAKRQMPDKLKRAFDANATLTRSEQKIIDDVRADMDRVNGRFDAELKRWRELVSAGAQPVQRPGNAN
jgi:chromosome segregation ATPase